MRAGYDEHEAEDGTIAPESTNLLDNARRLQTAVTVNKLRPCYETKGGQTDTL